MRRNFKTHHIPSRRPFACYAMSPDLRRRKELHGLRVFSPRIQRRASAKIVVLAADLQQHSREAVMNKIATAVCSLVVVAGLASAQSDLRSGPYVLGGMVMTPHSRMNGDFEVRLLSDADVPIGSLRAYPETQFSFRGLAPGVYYVEIEVSGYRTAR